MDARRWEEPTERKQVLSQLEREGYAVLAYRRIEDKYEVVAVPTVSQ